MKAIDAIEKMILELAAKHCWAKTFNSKAKLTTLETPQLKVYRKGLEHIMHKGAFKDLLALYPGSPGLDNLVACEVDIFEVKEYHRLARIVRKEINKLLDEVLATPVLED